MKKNKNFLDKKTKIKKWALILIIILFASVPLTSIFISAYDYFVFDESDYGYDRVSLVSEHLNVPISDISEQTISLKGSFFYNVGDKEYVADFSDNPFETLKLESLEPRNPPRVYYQTDDGKMVEYTNE